MLVGVLKNAQEFANEIVCDQLKWHLSTGFDQPYLPVS